MSADQFRQAEDRYFALKGQLATGHITQNQFDVAVKELMVQDMQGRYWMLGPDSGKWYVHDGKTWVEAQPPGSGTPADPPPPLPQMQPRKSSNVVLIAAGIVAVLCVLGAISLLLLANLGTSKIAQANPTTTPVGALVAVATTVTLAPSSTAAPTRQGGGAGRIAFATNRDGNNAIYVMNADGSQPINLMNGQANNFNLAWSPDGGRIAFSTDRDKHAEIYIMNANGGYPTRLTDHPAGSDYPSWSPDGARIAFESPRDGKWRVYVMKANGSDVTRLTNGPGDDGGPDWSPDGKRIAFHSTRDGNSEIYVMNADGSQPVRLTNTAKDEWLPKWSPDGTRIAFASNRDGNSEIYVMNADGSLQTRLTRTAAPDSSPIWSGDGTQIFFDSERDGNHQIYSMKADGSQQIRISNNAAWEGLTAWQPREASVDSLKTPPISAITPWPTYTPTATPTITTTQALVLQTPLPPGALSETSDISGVWDSDLGQVIIALWKSQDNRLFPVTGSWTTKDGNKGIIKSGTFNPQSGLLEISYSQQWNNVEGTARFNLSVDGKTLQGTWKEPSGQGDWIMRRNAGTTTSLPSSATPTVTLVPATAIPAIPPGLYVTAMGMDQAQPAHGQNINFTVSFLNTNSGNLSLRWKVFIYRADNPSKSTTESAIVTAAFPPGPSLEQSVPMNFRYGATGQECDYFFARVDTLDSNNKPTELTTTDGKVFEKGFSVCK